MRLSRVSKQRSDFDNHLWYGASLCHDGTGSNTARCVFSRAKGDFMAKPKPAKRMNKIDEEVEETFPASDPPAFMNGIIGAPPRRMTAKKKAVAKKAVKKAPAKRAAKKTKAKKKRK
jgi:hypothetical protein